MPQSQRPAGADDHESEALVRYGRGMLMMAVADVLSTLPRSDALFRRDVVFPIKGDFEAYAVVREGTSIVRESGRWCVFLDREAFITTDPRERDEYGLADTRCWAGETWPQGADFKTKAEAAYEVPEIAGRSRADILDDMCDDPGAGDRDRLIEHIERYERLMRLGVDPRNRVALRALEEMGAWQDFEPGDERVQAVLALHRNP